MNKFDLKRFWKDTTVILKKHSPEILTGIGIAGMVTTTVLAVKATPKALMIMEERKLDLDTEELTKVEVVKSVWPCYIPAAVTAGLSIACIIGASSVNLRRNAALAAAYALSDSTLKEYREKVVETLGEKKEVEVRDAIAKDKVEKNQLEPQNIIITGKGSTRCLDPFTGHRFESDIDKIKRSVNELNERMLKDMYISLNDFYEELGIDDDLSGKIGDKLGWRVDTDGLIEIRFSSQLDSDGTPCLVIDYINPPTYDYDKIL